MGNSETGCVRVAGYMEEHPDDFTPFLTFGEGVMRVVSCE